MQKITLKTLLIIIPGSLYILLSAANAYSNDWKPQIVEKMYVLPPQHLNKVLNSDFNKSLLALNLQNKDNVIKNKIDKITELNSYLPNASKEEILEIKHQIILNKRDYIKEMNDLLLMKRQKLNTKKDFFEKIQKNIKYNSVNNNPESKFFINKNNAIKRAQKLDFKILEKTAFNLSENSRYFNQYKINKDAISKLEAAIKNHPMNSKSNLSKEPENKLEAIRNYIHNIETEIAVLEMKEQMISYMAKIVALDAMDLAEKVAGINSDTNNNQFSGKNYNDPTEALEVFTQL